MAKVLVLKTTLRNDMLDEIITAAGTSCKIEIYAGTHDTTETPSGTLLVTQTGNASQFGTSASGTLTISAVSAGTVQAPGGTAGFFVIKTSADAFVASGNITTIAANDGVMLLDDTSLVTGGTVSLNGTNQLVMPHAST